MSQASEMASMIKRLEADLKALRDAHAVLLRLEGDRAPLEAASDKRPAETEVTATESEPEELGEAVRDVLADRKPRTVAEIFAEVEESRPSTNYKHLAGWLARAAKKGRIRKVARGKYRRL